MSQPEIRLEASDGVAIITLDAPQRKNAITPAMARQMVAAFDEVDANQSVAALVVYGAGGAFCAGAHRAVIDSTAVDPLEAVAYEDISIVYESFARLGRVSVPTIAAVCGPVVGAGMNLALGADLRIMASDARLMSGFLRIGLHPGGGYFTLSNRVAGAEATAAMGLFGEEITGTQAKALGMAWEAVDEEDVLPRATALASRLAGNPQLARDAVRSFRLEVGPPALAWPVALQMERAPQLRSFRQRH